MIWKSLAAVVAVVVVEAGTEVVVEAEEGAVTTMVMIAEEEATILSTPTPVLRTTDNSRGVTTEEIQAEEEIRISSPRIPRGQTISPSHHRNNTLAMEGMSAMEVVVEGAMGVIGEGELPLGEVATTRMEDMTVRVEVVEVANKDMEAMVMEAGEEPEPGAAMAATEVTEVARTPTMDTDTLTEDVVVLRIIRRLGDEAEDGSMLSVRSNLILSLSCVFNHNLLL